MSNVIDIERLAEMPINDKFSELLFGTGTSVSHDVFIEKELGQIIFVKSRFLVWEEKIKISFNGSIKKIIPVISGTIFVPVNNAFQIVRYIDKYLNGGKSDIEHFIDDIHTSISIDIVPVDDTDNVMFGTVKKLAEKYL